MSDPILVVEADADLRHAITAALVRADYDCEVVSTCGDALLRIRNGSYAHILVDVDSASSLTAFYEALKAEPAMLDKVVLISGDATPESLANCPVLLKPFDRDQLLERVR